MVSIQEDILNKVVSNEVIPALTKEIKDHMDEFTLDERNEIILRSKQYLNKIKESENKISYFMGLIEQYHNGIQHINNIKKQGGIDLNYLDNLNNIKKEIYENEKKEQIKKVLTEMTEENLLYQDFLNEKLGQVMKITLVAGTEGGQVGVFEVSVKKAIELGILKGGVSSDLNIIGRFTFSLDKLRKSLDNKEVKEFTSSIANESQLNMLKAAYKEIKKRYDTYKYHSKEGNKGYIRFILWKRNTRWKGMKVSSQWGDISEAYATYYLKSNLYQAMTGDIEKDIDTIMKIVERVDNASGLFLGDISGDNGIEYAVKANGASTLSFNQIKLLAEKLSSSNFSKQMLLNMKEEAAKNGKEMKSRHPIFSATKKNIEKIINETVEDNLGLQSAQSVFKTWEKNR